MTNNSSSDDVARTIGGMLLLVLVLVVLIFISLKAERYRASIWADEMKRAGVTNSTEMGK